MRVHAATAGDRQRQGGEDITIARPQTRRDDVHRRKRPRASEVLAASPLVRFGDRLTPKRHERSVAARDATAHAHSDEAARSHCPEAALGDTGRHGAERPNTTNDLAASSRRSAAVARGTPSKCRATAGTVRPSGVDRSRIATLRGEGAPA